MSLPKIYNINISCPGTKTTGSSFYYMKHISGLRYDCMYIDNRHLPLATEINENSIVYLNFIDVYSGPIKYSTDTKPGGTGYWILFNFPERIPKLDTLSSKYKDKINVKKYGWGDNFYFDVFSFIITTTVETRFLPTNNFLRQNTIDFLPYMKTINDKFLSTNGILSLDLSNNTITPYIKVLNNNKITDSSFNEYVKTVKNKYSKMNPPAYYIKSDTPKEDPKYIQFSEKKNKFIKNLENIYNKYKLYSQTMSSPSQTMSSPSQMMSSPYQLLSIASPVIYQAPAVFYKPISCDEECQAGLDETLIQEDFTNRKEGFTNSNVKIPNTELINEQVLEEQGLAERLHILLYVWFVIMIIVIYVFIICIMSENGWNPLANYVLIGISLFTFYHIYKNMV